MLCGSFSRWLGSTFNCHFCLILQTYLSLAIEAKFLTNIPSKYPVLFLTSKFASKGFFATGNNTNRTQSVCYPRHAKSLSTVAYKSRVPETICYNFLFSQCFGIVRSKIKCGNMHRSVFIQNFAHQSVWRGPSILGIPQGSNHGSTNIFRRRRLVYKTFIEKQLLFYEF